MVFDKTGTLTEPLAGAGEAIGSIPRRCASRRRWRRAAAIRWRARWSRPPGPVAAGRGRGGASGPGHLQAAARSGWAAVRSAAVRDGRRRRARIVAVAARPRTRFASASTRRLRADAAGRSLDRLRAMGLARAAAVRRPRRRGGADRRRARHRGLAGRMHAGATRSPLIEALAASGPEGADGRRRPERQPVARRRHACPPRRRARPMSARPWPTWCSRAALLAPVAVVLRDGAARADGDAAEPGARRSATTSLMVPLAVAGLRHARGWPRWRCRVRRCW